MHADTTARSAACPQRRCARHAGPLAAVAVLVLAACGTDDGDGPPGTATSSSTTAAGPVIAVNYPLAYFAGRIAGGEPEVLLPAPPDVDPAFWMPDDDAIRRMRRAPVVLLNGATYAKWLDMVSLPRERLVDTSAAFADDYLTVAAGMTHSHGGGPAHSHAGTDFNTWVDPNHARAQAEAVCAALKKLDPRRAAAFDERAAALDADLARLDERLRALGPAMAEVPLVASHPVYGYVAARYGWNLEAVVWEPDSMPDAEAWAAFAKLLEGHPAKWMLYEDEPLPEIRAKLADDFGVTVVVLRPCGNRPPEGDYMSEMRAGIARLADTFGG